MMSQKRRITRIFYGIAAKRDDSFSCCAGVIFARSWLGNKNVV